VTPTTDWTEGEPALLHDRCPTCAHCWLFRRAFCPRCGAAPQRLPLAGSGRVVAATLVTRAPAAAWEPLVPYAVVLVDLDEGVRMLAHGGRDLVPGDRVQVGYRQFGDRLLPCFERLLP
jgi:uncharacterized OB-fold protein